MAAGAVPVLVSPALLLAHEPPAAAVGDVAELLDIGPVSVSV
jgi:hypothetical protein